MSDFDRTNQSVEAIVDKILTKVAEELTNSRDKYIERIMGEFDEEGLVKANAGGNENASDSATYQSKAREGSSSKEKSPLKIALTALIIALLLLLVAGIVAVVLSIYSPNSIVETVETVEEQAEAVQDEEGSASDNSSGQNAVVEPMVVPTDDAEIVELEYVDLFVIQYGDEEDEDVSRFNDYYVLVKNVGNRIICSPSISIDLLDENSEITDSIWPDGNVALLPGQYGVLKGFSEAPVTEIAINKIGNGFYDGLWQYEDIALNNAPDKVSLSDVISEADDIPVYPKAGISYIDYPVENTFCGADIGLEIQEIRVERHSTYDEVFVDVLNNTGYDLENISLVLCTLDKNGNVVDSNTLMNSSDNLDSVPKGEVATLTSPGAGADDGAAYYYTICFTQYEVLQSEIIGDHSGDFAYLGVTPQAVGNGVE